MCTCGQQPKQTFCLRYRRSTADRTIRDSLVYRMRPTASSRCQRKAAKVLNTSISVSICRRSNETCEKHPSFPTNVQRRRAVSYIQYIVVQSELRVSTSYLLRGSISIGPIHGGAVVPCAKSAILVGHPTYKAFGCFRFLFRVRGHVTARPLLHIHVLFYLFLYFALQHPRVRHPDAK